MNPILNDALASFLLARADDELILSQRNSEWTGHGPILEEDIAFTNLALDELGHARVWYELASGLGAGPPDDLVFFRDAAAFRNTQLVELPRGDWAFSMLRQYLFDAAEAAWLPALAASAYAPLAGAAAKVRTEELYHYRHSQAWVTRLGLGTDESQARMRTALDMLWPYTAQLFALIPGQQPLIEAGVLPDPSDTRAGWLETVLPDLGSAGLTMPARGDPMVISRNQHTEHLAPLIANLQSVARLEPAGTAW